jgi:hypothetical protein
MEASSAGESGSAPSQPETSKPEVAKLDAPFGDPPVPSAPSNGVASQPSSHNAKADSAPQGLQLAPIAAQHPGPLAVAAPRPASNMVAEHLVSDNLRGTDASPILVVATSTDVVAPPAVKPTVPAAPAAEKRTTPISIFVSRKTQKIYVRQNFAPLFDSAITVDNPEQPLGTHVFTALNSMPDGSTFHWNVVSMPGVPPKVKQIEVMDRYGRVRRELVHEKVRGPLPSPQTPAEALARLEIPQDVVDRISAMMVPGSSLIVSDQGLGEETGQGTDFIVVSR